MHCPRLSELPPPPAGRRGWPWTVESPPVPSKGAPRITIVTPSFNQGQYLEETIRSVLLQGYPDIEYIVMDGGSQDGSVEIIRKYEPWLAHWVSEKDGGQAAAIHRGFDQSTGELLYWVNSDDFMLRNALLHLRKALDRHPEAALLIGGYEWVDASGKIVCKYYPLAQDFISLLVSGQRFGQMAAFWKREAYESCGALDASLKFCFDYDLFLKLTKQRAPAAIDAVVAAYRHHEETKSSTIWQSVGLHEREAVRARHGLSKLEDPAGESARIQTEAQLRHVRRSGLLRDFWRDPAFAWRSTAARIRDSLVSRAFSARDR